MRITLLSLACSAILFSCGDTGTTSSVPNPLLEAQVEATKNLFHQRHSGNPRAYLPAWDKMQHFDAQVENLIANCGNVTDIGDIKSQLDLCAEAVNEIGWPDDDLQNRVYTELLNIKNNLGDLDSISLKEKLLIVQLIYWNEFSNWPVRHGACVDTVGTYVVNKQGKSGEIFSTPIAAIAFYTASNYRVVTGEYFNADGTLGGTIKEIELEEEHMPVYVDSSASPGHHKIPAQLLSMTLQGTIQTNNFYIEYDIK